MFAGIAIALIICTAFAGGLFLGWSLRDRNAYERGEASQGWLIEKPMASPIVLGDFESNEEDRRRE